MSVKFGEISTDQIMRNEYRIAVLEQITVRFMAGKKVEQADVEEIQAEVVRQLQKKYPNSGVSLLGA